MRLSIERVEKMLKEQLSDFRNMLGSIAAQQIKEVKKNAKKYKPLEPDENLMREIMRQEGANAKKGST